MVEKKRTVFLVSLYCTLLFSRKENIKFLKVALVVVHCNCLITCIMIEWGCRPWNKCYQYYSGYLLTCRKRQLKNWNKIQSLFKLFNKCTRTIECRLTSVFLKNLKQLSHSILVLLFYLWTDKCWLEKTLLTFCQINIVISDVNIHA